jgi:hypothetical protein
MAKLALREFVFATSIVNSDLMYTYLMGSLKSFRNFEAAMEMVNDIEGGLLGKEEKPVN